jgi:polysaccharide export outer membrane protein
MKLTPRIVFVFLSAVTTFAAQSSAGPSSAPATPARQQGAAPAPGGSAPSPVSSSVLPTVQAKPAPTNPDTKETKKTKGKGAAVAATDDADPTSKPYVIGPLDLLSVNVWNDPKLSGFFDVRPDGMISMPLIGEMRADGLTVNELMEVVKKRLSATVMEDPEVNVQVSRINSKKFSIMGGCARQGEFPLLSAMRVLDAFASCGGFKDFANVKKIYILRGDVKLPFNYKDVSNGKHMEQNRYLQNGDKIFVPE